MFLRCVVVGICSGVIVTHDVCIVADSNEFDNDAAAVAVDCCSDSAVVAGHADVVNEVVPIPMLPITF